MNFDPFLRRKKLRVLKTEPALKKEADTNFVKSLSSGVNFSKKNFSTFDKIKLLFSARRIFKGRGTQTDYLKMNAMIKNIAVQYIAPVVRHTLTAAGGWLVAAGLPGLSEAAVSNITDIVVGAVVFAVGLGWSLIEKKLRKKE